MLKGAQASVIKLSQLERTLRIDAQFFDSDHLLRKDRINKLPHEPLNMVAKIADGNHFPVSDHFQSDGIPYYRGQDVVGHFFIEQCAPVFIPETYFDQPHMQRSHLNMGDVLLSIIGTIGELSLVTSSRPATCSCKLAILRPRDIQPGCLATFLYSSYGRSQLQRFTRGAVQTGVLLEDMDQIIIPRFSPVLENAVANIITKAHFEFGQSKDTYKQAENVLLEHLGILNWQPSEQQSFVRKASETLIEDNRLDAEYYQPAYLYLVEKIRELGCFELGTIASVSPGFPWESEYFLENRDSGEPFVRIRDCKPGIIEVDQLDKLDDKYAADMRQPKAENGDLLLGMDGLKWFYTGLVQDPCYVNQRVSWIRLLDQSQVSPEYLMVIINSNIGQMQLLREMTIAHTVGHITNQTVRNLQIPAVSQDIHDEITSKVRASESAKQEAKYLLKLACKAIEVAIEEGESVAFNLMKGVRSN